MKFIQSYSVFESAKLYFLEEFSWDKISSLSVVNLNSRDFLFIDELFKLSVRRVDMRSSPNYNYPFSYDHLESHDGVIVSICFDYGDNRTVNICDIFKDVDDWYWANFVNEIANKKYLQSQDGFQSSFYKCDGLDGLYQLLKEFIHQTNSVLLFYDKYEILYPLWGANGILYEGDQAEAVDLAKKKYPDVSDKDILEIFYEFIKDND